MKKLLILFLSFAYLASASAKTITYTGTIAGPTITESGTSADPLILDFTAANVTSTITLNGVSFVTLKGGTLTSAIRNQCFSFANRDSNNITISGWKYTGPENGVANFVWLAYCYNLTLEGNTVDNVSHLAGGDTTRNHDLKFLNNYCRTSTNTTDQTDIIFLGDAYNVLIQGNKFISRAPGNASIRHNDCIQSYQKGGGGSGIPTGWVIAYNWIEVTQASGSGDVSWGMLEKLGGPNALKVYGNVMIGTGTAGNNGLCINSSQSNGVFYCYNNTFIRKVWNPDNTVRYYGPGSLYFKNNVMQSKPGLTGTFCNNTMTPAVQDYNFFYNSTPRSNSAGPNGSTTKDPKFTNFDRDDFSLAPGSPLIAAGDSSIGAEYNMGIAPGATWPNPRLVKRTVWDVGAYVANGAQVPTPTSTPQPTASPSATPPPSGTPSPSATPPPSPIGWKIGQAVMAVGYPGKGETQISLRDTPAGTVIDTEPVGGKGVITRGPEAVPPSSGVMYGADTPRWEVVWNDGKKGWTGQIVIEH
jgi:hypothetical protein